MVGICDGTATAEDPSGLEMAELMRLVDADLPIADFNPAALGGGGSFTLGAGSRPAAAAAAASRPPAAQVQLGVHFPTLSSSLKLRRGCVCVCC